MIYIFNYKSYFSARKINYAEANPTFNPSSSSSQPPPSPPSPPPPPAPTQEESRAIQEAEHLQLKQQIEMLRQENERLQKENERLKRENRNVKMSNYNLKRKSDKLVDNLSSFKTRLVHLTEQLNLSKNVQESLKKCSSEVPEQLFKMTAKRARGSQIRNYSPAIRKFALTLQLASSKAYRIIRKEFKFALPTERMIRHWCSRKTVAPFFQLFFNFLAHERESY